MKQKMQLRRFFPIEQNFWKIDIFYSFFLKKCRQLDIFWVQKSLECIPFVSNIGLDCGYDME